MTPVLIRPALPADIEACLALAAGSGRPPTALRDDIGNGDRLLLVAEEAGAVVAYGRATRYRAAADAAPDSAPSGHYLVGLAVAPSRRRQGVGCALTRARLAWIAARAGEAWYFANSGNAASVALHARFGFREVTRTFSFPGVSFDGGEGILFRAAREDW